MKLIMALNAEYHGFPITFNHLAFPGRFAFEVSQFPYVVYFHLPASRPTPFAGMGKQTFP